MCLSKLPVSPTQHCRTARRPACACLVVKEHVDAWNEAADDNDTIDMPNWEPTGNTAAAAETPEERAVDNVVITTADETPNTPPEDDGLGGANTQAEEPDEEEAAGK